MRSYCYIWHVLYTASFVVTLSVRNRRVGQEMVYRLVTLDLFACGGR